jgi:hypothetical protein
MEANRGQSWGAKIVLIVLRRGMSSRVHQQNEKISFYVSFERCLVFVSTDGGFASRAFSDNSLTPFGEGGLAREIPTDWSFTVGGERVSNLTQFQMG